LGLGSDELAMRLLDEAHLAVIPGKAFGADAHIRISFATSLEALHEAVARLSRWVADHV
jgi:aspartate aminotransferase